jgi:hypothetical protein
VSARCPQLKAADLAREEPIRLARAAEIAFPGVITGKGLHRLIMTGRLRGGQFKTGHWYTTLAWLDEYREKTKAAAETARIEHANRQPVPCIYVVGFGPYVKIGWTGAHFSSRLRALHGGCPEKLTTYATIPNGTRAQERALHRRFAVYRLQYEWFRREGELASWIDAGCPK